MIPEDKWHTVYHCDACEECEYCYDENGELTGMFRVGDDDICEWCIRHGRKPQ